MPVLDEIEEMVERAVEAGMAPQEAALGRDDGDPPPAAAGPASAAPEQPSQERPGPAPIGKEQKPSPSDQRPSYKETVRRLPVIEVSTRSRKVRRRDWRATSPGASARRASRPAPRPSRPMKGARPGGAPDRAAEDNGKGASAARGDSPQADSLTVCPSLRLERGRRMRAQREIVTNESSAHAGRMRRWPEDFQAGPAAPGRGPPAAHLTQRRRRVCHP
jgi:hypothetical protein